MVTIKFHVQVETQGAVAVDSSAVLASGFSGEGEAEAEPVVAVVSMSETVSPLNVTVQ
jgi:hypothetical protein